MGISINKMGKVFRLFTTILLLIAILSACTTQSFSPKPEGNAQIGDDIDQQNETSQPSRMPSIHRDTHLIQ